MSEGSGIVPAAEETRDRRPMCVLYAGTNTIVARVYLSPDGKTLRIALPELQAASQIRIDVEHGLIDFQRDMVAQQQQLEGVTGYTGPGTLGIGPI